MSYVNGRAVLASLVLGPTAETTLVQTLGLTISELHQCVEALRVAGVAIIGRPGGIYALAYSLELLDAEKILSALTADAREQVHALNVMFETDSTQAQALSTPAPPSGCALWLAERQTAGQGRRGREWVSPLAAHLYFSLSRRFEVTVAAMSGLSLAMGVVLAETLRDLGVSQIAVKWPNDLVIDGKKLGGILVQLRGATHGRCEAVIGVGINVRMPANHAVHIEQPWCDLSQWLPGVTISRNQLAAELMNRLLPALCVFEREGLTPFLPRWHDLDALRDRQVRVLDGHRECEGRMLGITDRGALRLLQNDGEHHYHGGEVSVRSL